MSSSNAAILTDASLSSRIQTIEEYIDSIRGVHKLVIYRKFREITQIQEFVCFHGIFQKIYLEIGYAR